MWSKAHEFERRQTHLARTCNVPHRDPAGKTVIIDPWIMNNPSCPDSEKKIKKVEFCFAHPGHGDHIGDAVEIIKQHNPVVVGIPELARWLGKRVLSRSRR